MTNPPEDAPPDYSVEDPNFLTPQQNGIGQNRYFRSTSTLSLTPSGDHHSHGKRRLFLIYVHGFMGSEQSFRAFPKHLHDLLTISLAETHHVYTKVYPRYKTRGAVHIARDNFSEWLSPHEAPDLDVILLGHSLGGIVSAEVALAGVETRLRHRILGLVNFDVPFLGLHPRVVATGLGGLFRRTPKIEGNDAPEDHGFGGPEDERFDPTFANDTRLRKWKGWSGARHFISKYSDHLSRNVMQYCYSFYDHAGCMNNYPELIKRHKKLLELEAIDHFSEGQGGKRRVRFVNYYTTSTGPVDDSEKTARKSKSEVKRHSEDQSDPPRDEKASLEEMKSENDGREASTSSQPEASESTESVERKQSLDHSKISSLSLEDKDPASSNDSKAPETSPSITTADTFDHEDSASNSDETDSKPTLRKFCYLPKSSIKGREDLWVPVLMEGIDEVVAHQSMFLPRGSYYDKLVGDTAARIEAWVQDDLTKQTILSGDFK